MSQYIYIFKVIDILIAMHFQLDSHTKNQRINKAYLNTTLSRSVSSGLHISFWKLFCLGRLDRHQALLLRKAGQTTFLLGALC